MWGTTEGWGGGGGWGFIADRTTEKTLRVSQMQRKGDQVWDERGRVEGREQTGEKRFRSGGEIRGFAGAAWTTSDLNGVLNPAVAYPDFSSIPLTPSTVWQMKHLGSHNKDRGTKTETRVKVKTVKMTTGSSVDSNPPALSILVEWKVPIRMCTAK